MSFRGATPGSSPIMPRPVGKVEIGLCLPRPMPSALLGLRQRRLGRCLPRQIFITRQDTSTESPALVALGGPASCGYFNGFAAGLLLLQPPQ